MFIKYSCICCFFICLLTFHSVNGQIKISDDSIENISVNQTDTRIKNLKKQAVELFEAYDKGNIEKFVAMSHPNLYKEKGRESFFEEVREIILLNSEIGEPLPSTVENPGEPVEFDSQIFCVVPYRLESLKNANKVKITAIGSMVGVSDDNGKTWKFIKGIAFIDVFPKIAGMILIPNPIEERFVNGIEQ